MDGVYEDGGAGMTEERKKLIGVKLAIDNARDLAEECAKKFSSRFAADIAGDLYDVEERIDRKIQSIIRMEMIANERREVEHLHSDPDGGRTDKGSSGVQVRDCAEERGSIMELFRLLDAALDDLLVGVLEGRKGSEDRREDRREAGRGCGACGGSNSGGSGRDHSEDAR